MINDNNFLLILGINYSKIVKFNKISWTRIILSTIFVWVWSFFRGGGWIKWTWFDFQKSAEPRFCYNYDTYGNSHTYGNYNSGRNFNGGSNSTKNPPDYDDYDYGYSRESHLNVRLTNSHFDRTENKTKSSKILYSFTNPKK